MYNKTIFISHSSKDEEFAYELLDEIDKTYERNEIWIDFFDLSAGDELVPIISNAIGKAKWFILIASKDSMASEWVKHEAKIALFRSIEKNDFRIITIKIDDCKFPEEIDLELRSRNYIDASKDNEKAKSELITLLSQNPNTRSNRSNIFVDRGEEINELELKFTKTKILFIVGWQGIGKTSLVKEFANMRVGSPFLLIDITVSHDLNLLCRQIIARTNLPQPPDDSKNEILLESTLIALEKFYSETNGFLFLDDAENAMDETGEFRTYLKDFIDFYINRVKSIPMIISTIQKPEIKIDQIDKVDFVLLKPLSDQFILQCLKKLYFSIKKEELAETDELKNIILGIAGHPLSAYLLASYLAFESPQILNRKSFISKFRKNSAEYILQSYSNTFSDLDRLILEILAIVSTGISITNLSNLAIFNSFSLKNKEEEIKNSLGKLAQKLLINQDGEQITLHPFLQTFFSNQAREKNHFVQIAKEVGNLYYQKTMGIFTELEELKHSTDYIKNPRYRNANYLLIKYLAPAHRLLLISNQQEKARKLPISLSGHFREMVFISYQVFKEYDFTIKYADQWLEIEHKDSEVLLYKARALRRIGKIEQAIQILENLQKNKSDRLDVMVLRELGFIARDKNNLDEAIIYFEEGALKRNRAGNPIYPLIHTDLASALIDRAKRLGIRNPERKKDFEKAILLLEESHKFLSNFDSIHLPTYVDALINVDRKKEAIDLLEEALLQEPNNPRLNLRMAEIFRQDNWDLESAYRHATIACEGGLEAAKTIQAMIMLEWEEFEQVIIIIESFNPSNDREKDVVSTIRAKAFTGMNKFTNAAAILESLDYTKDPYACLALIGNLVKEGETLFYAGNQLKAKEKLLKAKKIIQEAKGFFPDHAQIDEQNWNADQLLEKCY